MPATTSLLQNFLTRQRWVCVVAVFCLAVTQQARASDETSPANGEPGTDGRARVPGANLFAAPDRWRVANPEGATWTINRLLDPHSASVLKGDYPFAGDDWFLSMNLVSDTIYVERHNLDYSSETFVPPVHRKYFKRLNHVFQQTVFAGFEVFNGEGAFRPKDFSLKVTGAWRLKLNDQNGTADGNDDSFGLQECFLESRMFEIGRNFDTTSIRIGQQGFNSDFLGLVYNDVNPGIRVLGELSKNRVQYNLAFFDVQLKDAETALSRFAGRAKQSVMIANMIVQDVLSPGWFVSPSVHYNRDRRAGTEQDVWYFGASGAGVLGRFEASPALYLAIGKSDTPGRRGPDRDVRAWLAACELRYPIEWVTPNLTLVAASGDNDPTDNRATGFDAINDNVGLGAGPFGYIVAEKIQFAEQTLFRANSLLPSARQGGASNYINPGILFLNIGCDFKVLPQLDVNVDLAAFNFFTTRVVIDGRDRTIARDGAYEAAIAARWRPVLTDNIILAMGIAGLEPLDGLKELYGGARRSFRVFFNAQLVF